MVLQCSLVIKKNQLEVILWLMQVKRDYTLEKGELKVGFVKYMIVLAYQKAKQYML